MGRTLAASDNREKGPCPPGPVDSMVRCRASDEAFGGINPRER